MPARSERREPIVTFKTIRDARLYLISKPSFDFAAFSRFLESDGQTWSRSPGATPSENIIEVAGRICYMSFGSRQSPKTNGEYVSHLIAQGHESVLEHASWTFVLTGVSRAFTHQFVRHRIGFSYSQLSQQYRDQSSAAVIEPLSIAGDPKLSRTWRLNVQRSLETYRQLVGELESELLRRPVASRQRELTRRIRSAARSILPESVETTIAFTANARAIRHFLDVRGSIEGDDEMRIVSGLLLASVQSEAPALFANFYVTEEQGLPIVVQRDPSPFGDPLSAARRD